MTGRGGGGRDRPHSGGDYSHRMEERERERERERRTGWDVAPNSRHLWVGNLSPRVTQSILKEQFLRFGDLEGIAHNQGRSYAFVNFMNEEDAVIALRTLQGFNIFGSPIKIEFTKRDRATMSSHDEGHLAYNEGRHSIERGEPFLRRDSRPQRPGPERSFDNSRGNKNSEPSEMLWIGFPAFLDVDDVTLRRAFSPFGEIEKITTFPGRSYAFVRYRSVVAACRAKEALNGKLFDNPRVSICFAKSDTGPAEQGRSSTSTSFPPHFRSNFHPGPSGQGIEPFQRERSFDSPNREFHMASPRFLPNMDRFSGDPNIRGFDRKNSVRTCADPGSNFPGSFERVRFQDEGPERRMTENAYERHGISPAVERDAQWHDLPFERPWRTPHRENSWGVDDDSFPLAKKLKTDSFPDKELPEYPFSGIEQERHDTGPPKLFSSFPEHHHAYDKNFDPVPFGHKGIPDSSRNLTRLHAESNDPWRTSDGFKPGPGTLSFNPVKLENINPEPHPPPLNEEWKWEGTIAKGGTPVCHARCFPVGKVLDFMLPEFLNCTARTDLDMLAKHYYQAASTWVVFFVPETDADITFYNEFMHYLGEKQRAAVAKLGEKMTLFLVPPSEFSEQVLKVPGKVSISGVIIQFQHPSSTFNSLHPPLEAIVSKCPSVSHGPMDGVSLTEETLFRRRSSPDIRPTTQCQNYFSSSSGLVAPVTRTFSAPYKPGDNLPYSGPVIPVERVPDFHGESRQDQLQYYKPMLTSNWPVHMPQNSSTGSFPPLPPNAALHSFDNSMVEEYQFTNSKVPHDGRTSTNNAPETLVVSSPASKFPPQQDAKPPVPSSLPIPLQPEQLAQLAALLGQQKQLGKETIMSADGGQPSQSQNPSLPPQASMPPVSVMPQFSPMHQLQQYSSTVSVDHFSHLQQLQHQSSVSAVQVNQAQQLPQHASSASTVQPAGNPGQQSNQQAPNSTREETEADPQKRLQATLQLAAALLQQIQQQSKNC